MSTASDLKNKAWVIKYRPKTIEQLLSPRKIKERWKNGDKNVDILFSGPPGTGKTSLAKIISIDENFKVINCSKDNGIDVIRGQIMSFGTTASLKKGEKRMILDEFDGLTPQAQNALKATMDELGDNVKFTVTTNHVERIIPALMSRFEHSIFEFEKDELKDLQVQYIKRLQEILKLEGFTIANDAMTYLLENIFPDIRQTLILLYQVTQSMGSEVKIITLDLLNSTVNSVDFELYKMLTTPKTEPEMYKFVMGAYSGRAKNAFVSIGEPFLKWLLAEEKQPEMVLTIASIVHKYQFESSMTSYNPMLGLLACCNAINSFFRN